MPVYFAYGSNMDPHRMDARVPGARAIGPGRLDGFRGHPTFFRREDVIVEGPEGPVIAWTHRVAHQGGSFVRPTDAYLQRVRSAIRVQGLPPEALDILDSAARPPGRPSIS